MKGRVSIKFLILVILGIAMLAFLIVTIDSMLDSAMRNALGTAME